MTDIPYPLLAEMADEIFSVCEDDDDCLVSRIAALDDPVRTALLASDLLNAWQVFYWYFREHPGEDIQEILLFTPAGNLRDGISLGETGLFTLGFTVNNDRPEIVVADDLQVLSRFTGKNAWRETLRFMEEQG